jgi:transposase
MVLGRGDETAWRFAAVQLVATGTAGQREGAEAFGMNENKVWRWRQAYRSGGVGALAPRRRGPQGPSKLDEATVEAIVATRGQGVATEQLAERVGVSLNSVSRALKAPARAAPEDVKEAGDA